jgi:uncharacterized protein (DUF111 family)
MRPDCLVIRAPSGLAGDIIVAGLARLLELDNGALRARLARIPLPDSAATVSLERRMVHGVSGCGLRLELREEHAHRGLAEIAALIDASALRPTARAVALSAFTRLAEVEGEIHGLTPEQVHFHEVGALDSIIDVCLAAELHAEMGSPPLVCSPLPVSDGVVKCQHGLLSAPPPAVLRMLEGVPVYGVEGAGELVTPTALALLHALQARFGAWPAMTVVRTARAYGSRVFAGIPNGAIFVWGTARPAPVSRHPPQEEHEAHAAHAHPHDHAHAHTTDPPASDVAHPRHRS